MSYRCIEGERYGNGFGNLGGCEEGGGEEKKFHRDRIKYRQDQITKTTPLSNKLFDVSTSR